MPGPRPAEVRDPVAVALQRTQVLLETARWADAAASASRVLAARPEEAQAWFALARAELGRQDAARALTAAERGLAVAPDREWGRRLAGHALLDLGRPREALRAAQLTVARENTDVVGLRWVRQAYALGLGAVLALGLAFLLEWLAFSDGARPPILLVVGVAAAAALVWWNRRIGREVPPAIRRPMVRRLVRRPLLLLAVVLNGLVLLLVAALTFLPYDVAVLGLVLVRPIAWLDIAYVVAGVMSVRRSRFR